MDKFCIQDSVIWQHNHQEVNIFTAPVLFPHSQFDGVLERADQRSQLNLLRSAR
jgi:hypothetical protein